MTYVKIHDKMLSSSIMEHDIAVRWAWVVILALADQDGMVLSTPNALARQANMSLVDLETALAVLMAPDPNSTSKAEEGRRVVEASTNQYRVVNYEHYRQLMSKDDQREKTRLRVARHRAKKRDVTTCNASNDIADTDTDTKAETDTHSPSSNGRRGPIPFDEFWNLYPRKDARKLSRAAWCRLTIASQQAALAALPHHVEFWVADGRTRKTTPLPTTWINGERWVDEIDSLGGTRSAHADKWDADGNPK